MLAGSTPSGSAAMSWIRHSTRPQDPLPPRAREPAARRRATAPGSGPSPRPPSAVRARSRRCRLRSRARWHPRSRVAAGTPSSCARSCRALACGTSWQRSWRSDDRKSGRSPADSSPPREQSSARRLDRALACSPLPAAPGPPAPDRDVRARRPAPGYSALESPRAPGPAARGSIARRAATSAIDLVSSEKLRIGMSFESQSFLRTPAQDAGFGASASGSSCAPWISPGAMGDEGSRSCTV